jgi:hypothetical protein
MTNTPILPTYLPTYPPCSIRVGITVKACEEQLHRLDAGWLTYGAADLF